MKKTILSFLALTIYVLCACKSSPKEKKINTEKTSTNKEVVSKTMATPLSTKNSTTLSMSASTFYVICSQHTGGWCSGSYNNYDSAKVALTSHRNSTGHTDNDVSNNCPF